MAPVVNRKDSMPARAQTLQQTFSDPWPDVLVSMRQWVREQLAFIGGAAKLQIEPSFSIAALQAARAEGRSLQPALDEFRCSLVQECGVEIPLPQPQQGLHPDGPHWIRLSYWK